MKILTRVFLGGLLLLPGIASAADALAVSDLLHAELESVPGREVRVSRVEIPPNMSLAKHWHPGEEFAYVLSGSTVLWQEGKDDQVFAAGETVRIPFRQVHTAIAGPDGAVILVFRVHESGKPERILVNQ